MSSLWNIRKQHGWTQTKMAAYLDISQSMVTMVENGTREIPKAALKKLNSLEQAYNETAAQKMGPALTKLTLRHATARKKLKKLLLARKRQAKKLAFHVQQQRQVWLNFHVEAASAQKLKKLATKLGDTSYDGLVDRLANDNNKKMAAFDPLPLLELQTRLDGVLARIACLEVFLKTPASKWFQLITADKNDHKK